MQSMRQILKLHPGSRSTTVTRIEVEAERLELGTLRLRYIVTGRVGDLRLPPVVAPARADELWRHTCFEAFVRRSPRAGYTELNFAPSTQWAAYRFDGYRTGMTVASEIGAPRIDVHATTETYELQAAVAFDESSGDGLWCLGLSAVIEEMSGRNSYWALAHPPGKPDFHHPDCFALELVRP
jgi:hypothetical protein